MNSKKTYAEERYAKLKQHLADAINRNPVADGKPRMAHIRNEFIGWARSVCIERNYRMIESYDNNELKLTFCEQIYYKRDDGTIAIKGSHQEGLNGKSIHTIIRELVQSASYKTLYHLIDECSVKVADDLNVELGKVSRLLEKLRTHIPKGRNTSPATLPKSLRLLNNLPEDGEQCALAKILWDTNFFSREYLSLTLKIFGFPGTIEQYNWVAKNYTLVKKLQAENPSVCRLLSAKELTEKSTEFWYNSNLSEYYLQFGDNAYKKLKDDCQKLGLTSAGWKWLCKQGIWFLGHIPITTKSAKHISSLAMKNIGKIPKISGGQYIIGLDRTERQTSIANLYLEQLAKGSIKAGDTHIYRFTLDYAEATMPRDKPCKMKWSTLQTNQERWHRDLITQRKSTTDELVAWEKVIPEFKGKSLSATELSSNHELQEEGNLMQHCVGGANYTNSCRNGTSAIFSIKDLLGNRVATLELHLYEGKYIVRQCYGVRNSPVSKNVVELARKLAKTYTETAKKLANSPVQLQVA